jgi:hypothetical protein
MKKMKNQQHNIKAACCISLMLLLLSTSIAPALARSNHPQTQTQNTPQTTPVTVTLYGTTGLKSYTTPMTQEAIQTLLQQQTTLRDAIQQAPQAPETKQLQTQFLTTLLATQNIPSETQQEMLNLVLQPPILRTHQPEKTPLTQLNYEGTARICSFVSFGEGSSGPIIILPRFIPFILTPIPRIFMHWNADDAVTSCGNLRNNKGFIAEGAQQGNAWGFWGIGFTVHLPPMTNTYGLFGYALYSHVSSEYMEYYPPNSPPEITGADPADNQQNVPNTLSELRFQIADQDSDLMSYNVTTTPDIGSGSGGLKTDGVYSIPISGLQELTKYTWHVQVSDGKASVDKTYKFTTAAVAPVISNPVPADNEREIPMDITELRFTIRDHQSDAMDYTIQTQPNVGSAQGTGVHDGTYTVPVSGLTYGVLYKWFINATDGTHWTRKVFSFITGYPSLFDPYQYGWHYRKQITIDHTQVASDLSNFPVLISLTDQDLLKAQTDGKDLLFMNGPGLAKKWHHEIESFTHDNGRLVAWVNIPDLSATEDTTFYLYYGNPSCTDQQYPEKTWDSSYLAVWHMNDATSTTVKDSTGHGFTGVKRTASLPSQWSGKVGNGQLFNLSGSDWAYIAVDDQGGLSIPGDFTISAWILPYSDNGMKVAGKHQEWRADYQGYAINWNIVGSETKMSLRCDGGGYAYQYIYAENQFPNNNWYYLSGEKRAGTNYVFVDGQQQSQTGSQSLLNSDNPFCIGAWQTEESNLNFNGVIDEVRLSSAGRPPAWVQTEYNTMNDPFAFYTVGPEEQGP